MVGGRLLLKAECLQTTGSFKFRGATNALLELNEDQRKDGVIAYSSGNHALAVATAAKRLGVHAVVVMPSDAPFPKIQGARLAGAEVIAYNRDKDDRMAICATLAQERGLTLIPPFDSHAVIAGQGTLAIEAFEQAEALGYSFDNVFAPCSGGGLVAGCALVARELAPDARIFAVEPEGFDDTARSLTSGEVHRNTSTSGSICDALLAVTPGKLTLPLLRRMGVEGAQVSDDQVMSAMRCARDDLGLVVEPGGAAAMAAAMASKRSKQRTSLVVVSGANIDPDLARLVAEPDLRHA
jgi:threonine dehydratase